MEKLIHSRDELIEKLKDLKAVETLARDSYSNDIKIFTNITIVNIIDSIRNDELHHIFLLEQLLGMLENK
jgi:hypothetical protein